jgi:membrane associated rhomboid family serine protease
MKAFRFYVRRPYLQAPPALAALLEEDAASQVMALRQNMKTPEREIVKREQATLDDIVARAVARRGELPLMKYGYKPAEGSALKLFTSMFLHAGLAHLLGNLLFFFVSGPFIEDVFGRPLFTALYLFGGVVAALTFAARVPDSTAPLVGASGAIAAVMGAYLVRFYASRIEFLFVPILWRPHYNFRFFLPAFVVLPFWFIQPVEMRSEAGSGVAFSAHVGGFVFGAIFAFVVSVIDFEKKYVDPKVTEETTWEMDERLARAIASRRLGDDETAKQILSALLRDQPSNIDALRTALEIATDEEDWPGVDRNATRLITLYVDDKMPDTALELVSDVTAIRGAHLPKFLARAAALVERQGDREWALALYQRLYDIDPTSPAAVGTLVKTSALLRAAGDSDRAREALQKARTHPSCNAEWATTIDSKLALLGPSEEMPWAT